MANESPRPQESGSPAPAVTAVLNAISAGDQAATDELLPLVYEELRKLAQQRLSREPGGGAGLTLQPTALVHEAYLRLLGESDVKWTNRGHFFAAAANAMRRIMVERARRHRAARHGGARQRLTLDESAIAIDQHCEQLLDLDKAMTTLESRDPRKAQIVMLRFYAGLNIEQTALALDLSPATVKNEWRFARAWLHSEMSNHGDDH